MNHRVLLLVSQKELPTVLRLRQKEKKKKKSIKLTGASDKCAASGEFVDPFDSNRILQRSVIGKRERGGVSKQPGPPSTTPFFLLNLHIFHLDHLLFFSRLFSSMSFTSLPVRRRLLHSSSSRS
jgi:hypothetical protein